MRQRTKGKTRDSKRGTSFAEPLTESAIPLRKSGYRAWEALDGEYLVKHAVMFVKEKGITGKHELRKADSGLYQILRKRRLLRKIGLECKRRSWSSKPDEQLIQHVHSFMEEKGISGKKELEKADSGLCRILRKRRLLGKINFEQRYRAWSSMTDEQLLSHALSFIEGKGIRGKKELQKADSGLHYVLKIRGLIGKIAFEQKRREARGWSSVSDEQLLSLAFSFMEERCITSRKRLEKGDRSLYNILRKRNLLDAAFAPLEQSKEREAVQQVIDALRGAPGAMSEFGSGK